MLLIIIIACILRIIADESEKNQWILAINK